MMRAAIYVLLSGVLAGCGPDNATMEERTKDRRALLVADESGNRYAIIHSRMNCFLVQTVDGPDRAGN